jgi:sugar O-acyltransferase (sialic acid O-acetyltransferase NeuD family)
MKKQILIAGTGGFAKEVLNLIKDMGLIDNVIGFIEPDDIIKENKVPPQILNKPVFSYSMVDSSKHVVTIAIGDSHIREKVTKQLPVDTEYLTLIHPNTVISEWVTIGAGSIVCAGTIITCEIKIGKHTHLNLNTTIGHDCVIGDFFTTAPNVNISGECHFGSHVYFGTSSCVRDTIAITDNVIVGMGAVVTKNITESGVYIGNPAKKLIK